MTDRDRNPEAPGRVARKLKAERIQGELDADALDAALGRLPGWRVTGEGTALERTLLFPTPRAVGAYLRLVYELGDAVGYLPGIEADHLEVTLTVSSRRDGAERAPLRGVDLGLARAFSLLE